MLASEPTDQYDTASADTGAAAPDNNAREGQRTTERERRREKRTRTCPISLYLNSALNPNREGRPPPSYTSISTYPSSSSSSSSSSSCASRGSRREEKSRRNEDPTDSRPGSIRSALSLSGNYTGSRISLASDSTDRWKVIREDRRYPILSTPRFLSFLSSFFLSFLFFSFLLPSVERRNLNEDGIPNKRKSSPEPLETFESVRSRYRNIISSFIERTNFQTADKLGYLVFS